MERFMRISRSGFRLGKGITTAYFGTSVASADALFLVVGRNAVLSGMVPAGGLLGYWQANYLERRWAKKPLLEGGNGVFLTDLADLPADITGDSDWPIREEEGPVVVVPRSAVDRMWYDFWKWGIFLQTGELELKIEPPFFGRKRLFKWLQAAGWDVEGL